MNRKGNDRLDGQTKIQKLQNKYNGPKDSKRPSTHKAVHSCQTHACGMQTYAGKVYKINKITKHVTGQKSHSIYSS